MRVAIGADHAGFLLKEHLKETLQRLGHAVDDHGTDSEEPVDYPPICFAVAREVAEGRAERGIVLGGSGQGEQIAANKIARVRAALCHDLYATRLSRQHNDANVLSMGGRFVAFGLADEKASEDRLHDVLIVSALPQPGGKVPLHEAAQPLGEMLEEPAGTFGIARAVPMQPFGQGRQVVHEYSRGDGLEAAILIRCRINCNPDGIR